MLSRQDNERATLPVFLVLGGKPCLVIGAGQIACRKAEWLLESGSRVIVIAREVCTAMRDLETMHEGRLSVRMAAFGEAGIQVTDYALIISACGDEEVNRALYERATAAGVPLNVADVPELCSFFVPATIRRGPVCLAIGTGGTCPGLAKHLRQSLEEWLPDWYACFAEALADTRIWLRSFPDTSAQQRHEIMALLMQEHALDIFRESSVDQMKAHMRRMAASLLNEGKAGS